MYQATSPKSITILAFNTSAILFILYCISDVKYALQRYAEDNYISSRFNYFS